MTTTAPPSSSTTASNTSSTSSSAPASTQTRNCFPAPPAKHDYAPNGSCEQQWNYDVQIAPAVAFTALFMIVLIAHITLAIVHRKRFALVMIMGVSWETAAYVFRSLGALHQREQLYNNANFLLTLTGPLWINAFVYMTLGRMVYYFLPDHRVWRVKGRLLARWFVFADILCFIIQTMGVLVALSGSNTHNTKTQNLGLHIFNAGAGVQQAFVVIFAAILTFFVWRALQLEKRQRAPLRPQNWKFLSAALYFVLIMISVRCIFRLCEYSNLDDHSANKLLTNESYEYALDASPMLLASLALCICHPGRFLVGPESTFPSGQAKKEFKRREKEEKAARKAAKKGFAPAGTEYDGAMLNQQHDPTTATFKQPSYGYGGSNYEQMELGTYSPSHVASSTERLNASYRA